MKKGFALLLAAVLMLTGCGSYSAPSGTSASAEQTKDTDVGRETAADDHVYGI